jgi:hypothetical protein
MPVLAILFSGAVFPFFFYILFAGRNDADQHSYPLLILS